MRRALLMIVAVVFFAPPAWALSESDAELLLSRTGFLASPDELKPYLSLSRSAAVEQLVNEAVANKATDTPLPGWADDPIDPTYLSLKKYSRDEVDQHRQIVLSQGLALKSWWVGELYATNSPLNERMTLFWHNHFTSAMVKVIWPQLMLRQNELYRKDALGNYRDFLHDMARDPAMLIYLDNRYNKKGKANENFARELLELFTLGEGHYTEQDIKESARAWTGLTFRPRDSEARFVKKQHDEGSKTFLGKTGNFDGDDIIDIVLAQPQAADFIVQELWKEFVSADPDPKEVQKLAANFSKDWEIAPLIKALLNEPAFWDEANRGTLVKSPVELVVGTERALHLPIPPDVGALAVSSMGQSLFDPPNVKGWTTGQGWINTQSLLARRQFLGYLIGQNFGLSGPQIMRGRLLRTMMAEVKYSRTDIVNATKAYAETHDALHADSWLLATNPVDPPGPDTAPPDRLAAWLMDPVYQLK